MSVVSNTHSLHWPPRLVHRTAALLTLAVIILTPNISLLPQAWTGSLYNEKRLLAVLLLSLYPLLLILQPAARADWRTTLTALPYPARAGLMVVLGLGALSAALAPRRDAALLELANFSLLFVLALGIASWAREARRGAIPLFVCGLAAMALAYEVRFLAGWMAMLQEQVRLPNSEFFPGFVNVRIFNQVQTWTLPLLAVPFWLAKRSVALRVAAFTILALWWLLLYISASRGAFLAACGGAALTFVVFRGRSLPWLKIQVFAAGAAAMAYLAFSSQASFGTQALPQRLAGAFEDPIRLRLLHDAWNLFLRDPVLGSGPMHYAYYSSYDYLSPHNSPLQLLSEWGLPATLLLLLLGLWAIFAWTRQARRTAPENDVDILFRVALLASVSGAALESLVSGVLVMPLSQLLTACVIGLMLGDYLALRFGPAPDALPPGRHDKVLVAGLAAAVLALGSLSTLTLFQARELRLQVMEARAQSPFHGTALFAPRFWFPGQLKSVEKDTRSEPVTSR